MRICFQVLCSAVRKVYLNGNSINMSEVQMKRYGILGDTAVLSTHHSTTQVLHEKFQF